MDDFRDIQLNTSTRREKPCYCQACGEIAPTKQVEFCRLIGLVLWFHYTSAAGLFCKRCVHRYFWEYTVVTACFGWWSMISFIFTPIALAYNLIRYLFCLGMPAVKKAPSRNAVPPQPPSLSQEGNDIREKEQAQLAKRADERQPAGSPIRIIWDPPADSASGMPSSHGGFRIGNSHRPFPETSGRGGGGS